MKFRHTIALLGAITLAAAAPAGAVTVRVEGKSKTLLKATTVHLHSGWITKGGAPTGACSTKSAAGALDTATHHRWRGKYYSSFSGYLVTSIFGERYDASAKYYWAFFDNDVFASLGACAVTPHGGDRILFAAVSLRDSADYVLVTTGAPRTARAGHAFKVKVDYVNAKGKEVPLAGARLAGTGFTATTTKANGTATITPTKAGKLTLVATHKATKQGTNQFGYVRAASVTVHVTA